MSTHKTDPKHGIDRLRDIIRRLRGPNGCPWDREQTISTLKPFLIEETYELIDAIDSENPDLHREELGDVLLQVMLQSQIREEEDLFSIDDVADTLSEKLIRRHPHVFADVTVDGSDEVLRNWESIKATERKDAPGKKTLLDGIPTQLPSLQKAHRIQSRAARVGFDWDDIHAVIAKVDEELLETKEAIAGGLSKEIEEEIGDLLFAVVNLCRFVKVNPEEALRSTIGKFMRRFGEVESRLKAVGKDLTECTLAEMDAVWNEVKAEEH